MSRGPHRHVILSHGAAHGRSAGTYLAGRVPPREALELIPNELVREIPDTPQSKNAPRRHRPPKEEQAAAVEAPKPELRSEPEPEPKVELEPEEESSTVPTTVKQLYALRKAELLSLMKELGQDLDINKETVRTLRKKAQKALSL